MSAFRIAVSGVFALLLGPAGCSTVPLQSGQSAQIKFSPQERKQLAQYYEKELEVFLKDLSAYQRQGRGRHSCSLGLGAWENGVVYWAGPPASQHGVVQGDELVAINGRPVPAQDGSDWLGLRGVFQAADLYAGDVVALEVRRGGQFRTVEVGCADGKRRNDALVALGRSVASENWSECVEHINRVAALHRDATTTRGETFAMADLRRQCEQARGASIQRVATLGYDADRWRLQQWRYHPQGIDPIRTMVLANIQWQENRGFLTFANDLRAELSKAEGAAIGGAPEVRAQVSTGTCFAVGRDGRVLTAYHVVAAAREINVIFANGDRSSATIDQQSSTTDLALLRVDRKLESILPLSRSRPPQVGDTVFTMGYPTPELLGQEPKYTDGAISALSGPGGEATFMQITVPVQPGNSGGPLVNDRGEVVGVVSSTAAVLPFLKATGSLPQNVNWAVKAGYAAPLVRDTAGPGPAANRRVAIDRTREALCAVEAM